MLYDVDARIRPDLRYAWRGSSILIVDNDGNLGWHHLTGFFFRQIRFLRDLRLTLNGEPPYRCSLAEAAPNELEFAYIYPPVQQGDGGGSGSAGIDMRDGLFYRDLDLRLHYRVRPASLHVNLRITNRWQEWAGAEIAWSLAADYVSVDEAHFGNREHDAGVEARSAAHGVSFRYLHEKLPFETHVTAEGADWQWEAGALRAHVSLARNDPLELRLRVLATDFADAIDGEGEAGREQRLQVWMADATRIHAPAETPLVDITNRALTDLGSFALLEGACEEWLTPGAGVPLYLSLWGRDALTAAWQAALFDRGEMLGDVLTHLDRVQGRRVDPERDEEPGRIINQAKLDPGSRLGETPFARNYADFASPFMFIIGLGYHYVLTGDRERVARHWQAARAVLDWARDYGDRDGDGYLEYLTQSKHGATHQGWKDSENAVVDESGRQVAAPIAPCEIQGYYHVALQFMAVLSEIMGERRAGLELWREARSLKDRFNRDFWMEDEGFIAFGLDADKRPIRALTSNAGQCLPTGIVNEEHVPRLVRRMFEPDLFSGFGIRTLSTRNPAYHPLDYHLGSVWPVENGTILFGLRRYGLNDQALELARGLYDLARLWPGGRIPECVGGYARDEYAHPGAYPRANVPQAWNQSMFVILVQSLLGLVPFAPLHLLMVDPILPPWLPELVVKKLRVGDATVTLRFWRTADSESRHEVVELDGTLHVVRQPWIESFAVDAWDRVGGLAQSLARRDAHRSARRRSAAERG
jgi:glycogen debranching enzyme